MKLGQKMNLKDKDSLCAKAIVLIIKEYIRIGHLIA